MSVRVGSERAQAVQARTRCRWPAAGQLRLQGTRQDDRRAARQRAPQDTLAPIDLVRHRRILPQAVLGVCLASLAGGTQACWEQAGQAHGIAPALLYAIAHVESGLNPQAVNRSHWRRTGSYDIGLLQINSRHLPLLARHGIGEADLLDPCTNIAVGAWLLADSMARHGATWTAVGAYNAACTQLQGAACTAARNRYAWKVYRHLPQVQAQPGVRP